MKTNPSTLLSPRDINFLLYEWLDVESLTQHQRYSHLSRADFDSLLDLSADLAQREFLTHNRKSDENEPIFDGERVTLIPEIGAALEKFYAAGLFAASMPEQVEGGQLPHSVYRACFAFFQAANIATAAYPMLSAANANLLLSHGSNEQIQKYVVPIVQGRFFGTMCLSESEAGSSLADVRTQATIQSDGSYRICGNKMWISGGDHDLSENIVHLVLARCLGAPDGVRGLSLFLVPKILLNDDGSLGSKNDVTLLGINHKMGYRGTVNTVLSFGSKQDQPGQALGAVGWLVGEQNRGLEYMFHMMNEARIGVGAGAAAVGYSSYLQALEYAKGRLQGRSVDLKDPASPQIAIIEHADVRRMLVAAKSYVEGGLGLVIYCANLLDQKLIAREQVDIHRLALLLDLLTPVVKGWTSKWSLVANDLAIQIHGGYGYTRDYQVEQLWRDNRLNPIHEGTDGIQAIDLLGRKVQMQDGAALRALIHEMKQTINRTGKDSGLITACADQLDVQVNRLSAVTRELVAQDLASQRTSHAWLYADAFGHVVVAWIWLEQLLACDGKTDSFYNGKRAAAEYFYKYELTNVSAWLNTLEQTGRDGNNLFLDMDVQDL